MSSTSSRLRWASWNVVLDASRDQHFAMDEQAFILARKKRWLDILLRDLSRHVHVSSVALLWKGQKRNGKKHGVNWCRCNSHVSIVKLSRNVLIADSSRRQDQIKNWKESEMRQRKQSTLIQWRSSRRTSRLRHIFHRQRRRTTLTAD